MLIPNAQLTVPKQLWSPGIIPETVVVVVVVVAVLGHLVSSTFHPSEIEYRPVWLGLCGLCSLVSGGS